MGLSYKGMFYIQVDFPIGNFAPKITHKFHFSLKIGNQEILRQDLEIHFRWVAILEMYFLVKFCPYISVFDKVAALLILLEFDHGIDGEFHNDVIAGHV